MKKMLFVVSLLIAIVLTVASALADAKDEVVWFVPVSVHDVALSPDGTKLYDDEWAGGDTNEIVIRERDTQDGRIIRSLIPGNVFHYYYFGSVDIEVSKDGKYLAANYGGAPIIIFNLKTGKERHLVLKDSNLVKFGFIDIAISPDSKKIVGIYSNYGAIFYSYLAEFDIETGDSLNYLSYDVENQNGNMYGLYRIEYTPDGLYYAIVGAELQLDKKYGVWRENQQGILAWDAINHKYIPSKFLSISWNGFSGQAYFTLKFSSASGLMGFGRDNMINFYNYSKWVLASSLIYPNDGFFGNYDFSCDGKNIFVNAAAKNQQTLNETYSIQPQTNLYSYDSLYISAPPLISNDNSSVYGYSFKGIYKLNAYWKNTGISPQNNTKEMLLIYPNPATNELKIEINLQNQENCKIKITDITGKLIENLFNDVIVQKKIIIFNTQNLVAGAYFVILTTKTNVITKQFLKGK